MSLMRPDAFLSPLEIEDAVTRALAEDLGRAGDITSTATVPEDTQGRAVVVARKPGVVSGLPLVAAAFRRLSPQIEMRPEVSFYRSMNGFAFNGNPNLGIVPNKNTALIGSADIIVHF